MCFDHLSQPIFFFFKCNKLLLTIALDKGKENNFKIFFIVHNLV